MMLYCHLFLPRMIVIILGLLGLDFCTYIYKDYSACEKAFKIYNSNVIFEVKFFASCFFYPHNPHDRLIGNILG